MSASMSHEASSEPNLTPMLDMVFQLITFFMLVINFKGASMDLSLKLPVLGSARPLDTKGEEELLILNIDAEGRLKVYGVQKDVGTYIATEARMSELTANRKHPEFKKGDALPTTVVIRADKGIPFHLLHQIIQTCQSHGFRNFALKAMNRAEGT